MSEVAKAAERARKKRAAAQRKAQNMPIKSTDKPPKTKTYGNLGKGKQVKTAPVTGREAGGRAKAKKINKARKVKPQ